MCTTPTLNTRTARAFTLIELLVTIAVIAVLISILAPALGRARSQAEFVECKSNLRQLAIAFTTHGADNKGLYCTGASDNRIGRGVGAFDQKGWIADFVNGEYALPGKILCPTSPGTLTQNLQLERLNETPFRTYSESEVIELIRAGYNSNYTLAWFTAMTQMQDLFSESDVKDPDNTLGPLRLDRLRNISPSRVPLIADPRADAGDAAEINGERFRTVKALTDGPIFDGTMYNRQSYEDFGPAHLSVGGFNADAHNKTQCNIAFGDGHADAVEDTDRSGNLNFAPMPIFTPQGPRVGYADPLDGVVFGGIILSGDDLAPQ